MTNGGTVWLRWLQSSGGFSLAISLSLLSISHIHTYHHHQQQHNHHRRRRQQNKAKLYPSLSHCTSAVADFQAGVWISLVLWLLLIVVDILSLSLSGLLSRLPFPLSRLDSLNRRLDVGTRHQDNKADNTNLPRPSPDFLTQMAARTPPPKRPVPPKPPCVAQPLMTSAGEPGPSDEDSSFS